MDRLSQLHVPVCAEEMPPKKSSRLLLSGASHRKKGELTEAIASMAGIDVA
jgi:hypothetical protein